MRKSKQEQSSSVRRDKLCLLKKFVNVRKCVSKYVCKCVRVARIVV